MPRSVVIPPDLTEEEEKFILSQHNDVIDLGSYFDI